MIMIWVLSFVAAILFEDVITRWHLFNITDIGQLEGYRQIEGKCEERLKTNRSL